MFFSGSNCVKMDMGKDLSNKIVTVTDGCAGHVIWPGLKLQFK